MNQQTEPNGAIGRRDVLRAGVGVGVASVGLGLGTGVASAAYDGWLDEVDNYEGTYDYTGDEAVQVTVGSGNGLLFDPPAILVDPGTTVVWEWSGEGGDHNVDEVDDAFESELTAEAGHTFEHTFEEEGEYRYVCTPHEAVEMKGVVAVGDTDDDLLDPTGDANGDGSESGDGDEDENGEGTGSGGISLSQGDLVAVGLGLAMAIPLFAAGLGFLNRAQK